MHYPNTHMHTCPANGSKVLPSGFSYHFLSCSSVVTFIMHYINAPHVHRDADTGIKCTPSRFQEVTPTSVQPATGSAMRLSLTCYSVMCLPFRGSADCRPLQQPHSHNYTRAKDWHCGWREGGRQQPDNSASESSGQAAAGDRLRLTAPSMFKAVGLGGGLHSSQRRLWKTS